LILLPDHKDPLARQVRKAIRDQREKRVRKAIRDQREKRVQKASKGFQARKDLREKVVAVLVAELRRVTSRESCKLIIRVGM
jgi:hypothetical protein